MTEVMPAESWKVGALLRSSVVAGLLQQSDVGCVFSFYGAFGKLEERFE